MHQCIKACFTVPTNTGGFVISDNNVASVSNIAMLPESVIEARAVY